MAVPELFHHEHRFIGCLTVRRISAAQARHATGMVHQVRSPLGGTVTVLLATQAFDADGVGRCPCLAPDGSCTIHDDRKPAQCQAVPLDPFVPSELSHHLLAQRAREATFFGADCLTASPRPGYAPVVRRLALVDESWRAALARRRADLVDERRVWGDAVFGMLREGLFDDPRAVGRLPHEGFFALSMAPLLMTLAEISPRLRARSVQYLDAQSRLLRAALEQRTSRSDRGDTARQLGGFARANAGLRRALGRPIARAARADAERIETWAGMAPVRADERSHA